MVGTYIDYSLDILSLGKFLDGTTPLTDFTLGFLLHSPYSYDPASRNLTEVAIGTGERYQDHLHYAVDAWSTVIHTLFHISNLQMTHLVHDKKRRNPGDKYRAKKLTNRGWKQARKWSWSHDRSTHEENVHGIISLIADYKQFLTTTRGSLEGVCGDMFSMGCRVDREVHSLKERAGVKARKVLKRLAMGPEVEAEGPRSRWRDYRRRG